MYLQWSYTLTSLDKNNLLEGKKEHNSRTCGSLLSRRNINPEMGVFKEEHIFWGVPAQPVVPMH